MKTTNVHQWRSTQFFPDFQVKLMISLRSKSFRLVSDQRKTENGIFRFWPRPFRCGFLLSSLVLCGETARKRLLRRLTGGGKDKRAPPCLLLPAQLISLAMTSSSPPFHAGFVKAARKISVALLTQQCISDSILKRWHHQVYLYVKFKLDAIG